LRRAAAASAASSSAKRADVLQLDVVEEHGGLAERLGD
jgi:hypothetical protein